MSDKHLRRQSHHIFTSKPGISVWWYETPKGISIYHEDRHHSPNRAVDIMVIEIPWRDLRYALKRKDKPNG